MFGLSQLYETTIEEDRIFIHLTNLKKINHIMRSPLNAVVDVKKC